MQSVDVNKQLFWKGLKAKMSESNRPRLLAIAGVIVSLVLLSSLFITFAAHGPAGSHLVEVGPIHPDYGYPMWYRDSNGTILELCLDPTYCAFVAGDIPDLNSPVAMPGNFPGEAFYWLAEAMMPGGTPGNGNAIITMGLEAAFANDAVVDGDQIVFGRIRIRVDNLVEGGTYTVTHPFGANVFANIGPDAGPGAGAGPGISFVEDIGIGAPGDFTLALNSRIGPFLTWEAGAVAPPGFIGDGGLSEHRLVGSAFGTNYFRIEGPNVGASGSQFLCADPLLGPDPVATTDCIETDMFILLGKLAANFGVALNQATYSRSSDGTGSVDVFAHTVSGEVLEAEGNGIGVLTLNGDADGYYFGRIDYAGAPPTTLTLSNVSDNPTTQIFVDVADMVTITRAEYNPVTNELLVEAYSSDEFSLPGLTAVNFGPLFPTGSSIIRQAAFTGVMPPPLSITVVSDAGGSDTEPVAVTYVNAPPIANDDVGFLDVGSGATSVVVDILANDVDLDGAIDPTTVIATSQPISGTITIDGLTGIAAYTPTVGFLGADAFTYTVNDNAGATSNAAIVNLVVSVAPNTPPVANDDTAVTDEDIPLVIAAADLLLNDSDADGDSLNVESVTTTGTNGGAITDNLNGTYTYTPAADFFGEDSFAYTINDGNGGTSTANVVVTVNPINDAPIGVNDAASTPQNTAIIIAGADLLANDTDADGDTLTITAVDTYSVEALEQIAEGKNPPPIVDNGDGTYTYTPPDTLFIGLDTFSYELSDTSGVTSTAQVLINVTPSDLIIVEKALYKSGRWLIRGSGSQEGSIITVYLGPTTDGPIIGITQVNTLKRWRLGIRNSSVAPNCDTGVISVASSGGGVVLGFPVKCK